MNKEYSSEITVTKEEIDKIGLRSEEVREILGSIPSWTVRSGGTYLLLLILFSVAISWFIKFPDMISVPVVLTTGTPPSNIISASPGYLILWVKDSSAVKAGSYLGYIKSASDVHTILEFKEDLDSFKANYYRSPLFAGNYEFRKGLSLGELQDVYNTFIRSIEDYQFAVNQKNYRKQIKAINDQIGNYHLLTDQLEEQNELKSRDLALSATKYQRDSVLYLQKVNAKAEWEESKRNYLKDQREYKIAVSTITSTDIQVNELKKKIQELLIEEQQKDKDLLAGIEAAMNQLTERLKLWEQSYMLKAPFDGQVAFFKYWSDHQYLKQGEEIMAVISGSEDYLVKAKVPVAGSGKIKHGQPVKIKLDNFPFQEYGMINGEISSISLLPKESNYNVTIRLPGNLVSSYGKKIDFKQEMTGRAEIITEDSRLLERFFYRVRSLYRN